ncbi:hypothetical protein [Yoonia sp. BS5-3]|uniref:Uncharacterized protein n=1 Tax=Yoonia phaeophyticola TaxID=3137369 RepID=A0ABZ2V9I3_9RHOB
MLYIFAVYFALAACALASLSAMIFKIGEALAGCPSTGRAAKAGSLTIVTGFVAIGGGAILIIAAGVFMTLNEIAVEGAMAALGLSILCLGLGFTHAIATLRDVVAQAAQRAAEQ